ncbi:MAG: hypothetical protein D6786_07720 [Gammaproteobacteria bacterium]|nr:MAG: hypothetical protein D6786_07720 [Gammaproteobacteria bacterium]
MASSLAPIVALLTAWALLVWQITGSGPLWVKLLYALPLGFVYSMFFNLGHELCHRSYFRGRFWNHFWGRVLFSLIFHNYSLFEVIHNHHHHVYTNVKGLNSWSPHSPEEYRAMSPLRRLWERFLRSPAGIGVYYVTNRLFRLKFLPNRSYMGDRLRPVQYWDFALIVLVHAGLIGAVRLLDPQQWLVDLVIIEVVALLVGMHIVGTVVFLQHTHRDIPWFAEPVITRNPEEVTTTSPALAPVPVMDFSYHIMHHRKPALPVFELKRRERELYGDREVKRVSLLDLRHLFETMRHCQLYDYRRRRWMRFREVEAGEREALEAGQA